MRLFLSVQKLAVAAYRLVIPEMAEALPEGAAEGRRFPGPDSIRIIGEGAATEAASNARIKEYDFARWRTEHRAKWHESQKQLRAAIARRHQR